MHTSKELGVPVQDRRTSSFTWRAIVAAIHGQYGACSHTGERHGTILGEDRPPPHAALSRECSPPHPCPRSQAGLRMQRRCCVVETSITALKDSPQTPKLQVAECLQVKARIPARYVSSWLHNGGQGRLPDISAASYALGLRQRPRLALHLATLLLLALFRGLALTMAHTSFC